MASTWMPFYQLFLHDSYAISVLLTIITEHMALSHTKKVDEARYSE